MILAGEKAVQIVELLRRRRHRLQAARDRVESLFGFVGNADVTGLDYHPWAKMPLVPEDVAALALLRTWHTRWFKNGRRIEYLPSLAPPDLRKDLCSPSGPVTSKITRLAMGYNDEGRDWYPVLPFHYPLADGEQSISARSKYQNTTWEEPNWYIADRTGRELCRPTLDEHGLVREDYFMLIVAPNVFSKEAFESGKKHLVLSPTHGLSTLAMCDILDSDSNLQWIRDHPRSQGGYYQAIFRILGEETSAGIYGPAEVEPYDLEAIDRDDFKKMAQLRGWIP